MNTDAAEIGCSPSWFWGDWELQLCSHCPAHPQTGSYHTSPSPGKNPNLKFKVQFLLNAYHTFVWCHYKVKNSYSCFKAKRSQGHRLTLAKAMVLRDTECQERESGIVPRVRDTLSPACLHFHHTCQSQASAGLSLATPLLMDEHLPSPLSSSPANSDQPTDQAFFSTSSSKLLWKSHQGPPRPQPSDALDLSTVASTDGLSLVSTHPSDSWALHANAKHQALPARLAALSPLLLDSP